MENAYYGKAMHRFQNFFVTKYTFTVHFFLQLSEVPLKIQLPTFAEKLAFPLGQRSGQIAPRSSYSIVFFLCLVPHPGLQSQAFSSRLSHCQLFQYITLESSL